MFGAMLSITKHLTKNFQKILGTLKIPNYIFLQKTKIVEQFK